MVLRVKAAPTTPHPGFGWGVVFHILSFSFAESKLIRLFAIAHREVKSPGVEGNHCLSATLNSGKIHCRERALNLP